MADRASTLILKVDLECDLCYKKIRKTLCKLQDQEKIRAIAYDVKSNMVTLSGPFDPDKLSAKLRYKAREVIKDIEIAKEKPKEDNHNKDSKPANPSEKKEKEKDKPKSKSGPEPAKSKPDQPKKEPEKSQPQPDSQPKKKDEPKPNPMVHTPAAIYPSDQVQPVWSAAGPGCYCRPYQRELYWGTCNYCGLCYGPGQKAYSCEEDPTSCIIM